MFSAVNTAFLGKAFGCGCKPGFNANYINVGFFGLLLITAIALRIFRFVARATDTAEVPTPRWHLIVGITIDAFLCYVAAGLNMWA